MLTDDKHYDLPCACLGLQPLDCLTNFSNARDDESTLGENDANSLSVVTIIDSDLGESNYGFPARTRNRDFPAGCEIEER